MSFCANHSHSNWLTVCFLGAPYSVLPSIERSNGRPARPCRRTGRPACATRRPGRKDAFVRLVIGELLEGAAAANLQWRLAVELRDRDPHEAMTQLANMLPFLEITMAIQAEDIAKVVNLALDELEARTEASNPTGTDGLPLRAPHGPSTP